jgi:SAM-dependent methyltransferase
MSVIPWWVKIGVKFFLSRLPFGYDVWQKLGLFRHGSMDNSGYVRDVFNQHIARAGLDGSLAGKTILELGPGDGVATALLAACHGARSILLDAGSFASKDVTVYQKLANDLSTVGFSPPDISSAATLQCVLDACGAVYLTEGLKSFSHIETGSVDLIFSQAVLEHVRKYEFAETMKECRRVLSPNGVVSHQVDLRDHLGGGLNNLRFNEKIWESVFFVKSGFYTNRIRYSEMLKFFKDADFAVSVLDTSRWDKLPIGRADLNVHFAKLPDDELNVKVFDVLLRPILVPVSSA